MANTVSYARRLANIKPTRDNKGVEMEIKLIAYDNGFVRINGDLISQAANPPLSVGRLILMMMEELQKDFKKRTKSKQPVIARRSQ